MTEQEEPTVTVLAMGKLELGNDELREQVMAWCRQIGLDPNEIKPEFAIRRVGRDFQFHGSRMLRGEGGGFRSCRNEIATEPVTVSLGDDPGVLPEWVKERGSSYAMAYPDPD